MTEYAEERRERIVQLISEGGRIQVQRLAELLEVSPMTIRRDLERLESEGSISRVHGAASRGRERGYELKRADNVGEKRAIAEVAADFVHSGDTVFLDAGTTTFEIARRILDVPDLTVVTVDIKIAFLFTQCSDAEVMCCGGFVQRETGCVVGTFANQMVGYVQFDCAFLGVASISRDFNVLTPTMDKVTMKRTVIAGSERSYLVADASKFNRKALLKVNSLAAYTEVITTRTFSPDEEARLAALGACIHAVTV
ncbi:DeoR/GlpR family DNA-binding transcription regulator [Collinsella sp. AGMB00827]|uniref:DeoR/GlpR family DNA-binding transcription regulator n=1 Tax=Collinsella ureilytica TaxID=2869515 RepID=A0ABS7MIK3_9ACTN|nr:DeoR/GlpR family DNA-binding transcription regulator [Collinsella urealyticum]MBY4797117.1 DeoR/GlpR family DNA-binding transcription regulator [Collinsella urealyticum]